MNNVSYNPSLFVLFFLVFLYFFLLQHLPSQSLLETLIVEVLLNQLSHVVEVTLNDVHDLFVQNVKLLIEIWFRVVELDEGKIHMQ